MHLLAVVRIIKTGSFFALPVLVAALVLFLPLASLQKDRIIAEAGEALLADLISAPAAAGDTGLPPGPFLRLSVQPSQGPARIWTSPQMHTPDIPKTRPILTIRRGQDSTLTSLSRTARLLFSQEPMLIQIQAQQGAMQQSYLMRSEFLQAPLQKRALAYAACSLFLFAVAAVLLGLGLYLRVEKPAQEIARFIDQMGEDPQLLRQMPSMVRAVRQLRRISVRLDHLAGNFRRALRQKERLADAGEAVAKINHDLRNILSTATLVSEVLEKSDDPKIAEIGPVINRSLENASRLCQNMLDFMAHLPEAQPRWLEVEDFMTDLARASPLALQIEGARKIFVDPVLLNRLLLNLFRNAHQAGASHVEIDIWQAGNLAVLDISDNGKGIAAAQRPFVFQAFHSGHRGGSGLGMAIAKDMAVAMGGDIKLARSAEGKGTAFRLQLPGEVLENPAAAGRAAKTG